MRNATPSPAPRSPLVETNEPPAPIPLHAQDGAPPVPATPTASAVMRLDLAQHVERLLLHEEALTNGAQPRAIHQSRVALRRLRSDLATFGPLCDGDWPVRLRRRLGKLAAAIGAVRDRDVLAARLEEHRSIDVVAVARLISHVNNELAPLRLEVIASTLRRRHGVLLDELRDVAADPKLSVDADGDARRLLIPLVVTPWRVLHTTLDELSDECDDETLHAARIVAKRARYALTAITRAVSDAAALAHLVADLQDILGEHHDAHVTMAWLQNSGTIVAEPARQRLIAAEQDLADAARARVARARARVLDPTLRQWMLP